MDEPSIILESRRLGPAIEVAAVDEASGIEIRFSAPASTPPEALERLAQQKILYVKRRDSRRASSVHVAEKGLIA